MAMVLVTIAILACGMMTACSKSDDTSASDATAVEQQVADSDAASDETSDEDAAASEHRKEKKEEAKKKAEEAKAEAEAKAKKAKEEAKKKAEEAKAKEEAKKAEAKKKAKEEAKKAEAKKQSSKKESTKKKEETKKEEPEQKVVYVSVDNYCSKKSIKFEEGDTPYSVLKKTGAKVSARNTKYGVYVEGINDLFEFDKGDESGWMYKVNGKVIMDSAGDYKLSANDKVVWYYVTEFQK